MCIRTGEIVFFLEDTPQVFTLYIKIRVCELHESSQRVSAYSKPMQCQRCRLPLVAHSSLSKLSQTQVNMLTRDDFGYAEQNQTIWGSDGGVDASFILLAESIAGPNPLKTAPAPGTHSQEASALDKIFTNTGIDMPLCSDCADTVRKTLKTMYDDACSERDAYISFLNRIKDEPLPGSREIQDLQTQIRQLEKENERALKQLKAAEADKAKAEKELVEAIKQSDEQEEGNRRVFLERNNFEREFSELETEKHRLDAMLDYQTMQLYRLQHTNVYNDVFCVGHDGKFGTINGLRLGRLREKRVEWSEINAAWGQTLLLLATIIHRLDISIPEYRLKPLGSMSRIEKLNIDPETNQPTGEYTSLELFSAGEYGLSRMLKKTRLDSAMVAFLDVLHRVGKFVESQDPNLKLPYTIDGDKIGGCSIRLSANASDETWTAACKYVLVYAKWLLAYAVSN